MRCLCNSSWAFAVALGALAGCAPTLPVVVAPINCPVPAEQLARRCQAPQAIANGATYGEVLQLHQLDRKALRDCAAHDQLLAEMIVQCQRTIQDYNDRLVEINRQISGKP
ncbi:MAG: hypothetical protein Q7U26_11520 [Aquabacterium sp.]|nr:hypothetical protein [Aquabacterium sp.]